MAYEANRHDSSELEEERERANQNNANNIRAAADVAVASKNPYGVAIGGAVKAADKITGGKSTEALGKGMTKANSLAPGGKSIQNLSNRFSESGTSNTVSKAAAIKNRTGNTPNQVVNHHTEGGEQSRSLPSSDDISKQSNHYVNHSSENKNSKEKDKKDSHSEMNRSSNDDSSNEDHDKQQKSIGKFVFRGMLPVLLILFLPLLIIFLIVLLLLSSVSSIFSFFDDAFGINFTIGESTGDVEYVSSNTEQQDFFDRVNDIRLSYQREGKTIDPFVIVATVHVLNANEANIDYEDMNDSMIRYFANYMLDDNNYYNQGLYRNNLILHIIPKYLPKSSSSLREKIADEVFSYIEDYYDLIGKDSSESSNCSSAGNCSYQLKGFYIPGRGNVVENIQLSNVYVRLMQCGVADGHNYGGTFGQPLAGEELVPFEKYVLGVAYQEIGPSAPAEAIKAQMVAARSFILARHVDMGGWRTLKKEGDKWIIQAASCTQDQVYCDPDKGCSSNDGQWGQVHSGLQYASGFSRGPMDANSPLRTYASSTQGEVLVNAAGYIIYTGYKKAEQVAFSNLANSGLNYKQILLQVYNQGSRNYSAKSIQKNSCGGDSSCISTGNFANWKQFQGPWINTLMGDSGKRIRDIGCLVTSVSMQIAKSKVSTVISNFNPGTFVEYLNSHNGFSDGGNFNWGAASSVAPNFQYQGKVYVSGMTREEKLNQIKTLVNQPGVYVLAEVKGNTGQHWVAIDSVNGDTVYMMDPGSNAIDIWRQYNWANTSTLSYYRVIR